MNTNTLSIFSEIGWHPATAEAVGALLQAMDRKLPLTVQINSEGGSVAEAVAIYNLLRTWPAGVTIDILGWALSAATLIAMAGSRIRMHETSLLMVHAPLMSASGNAGELRQNAEILDQVATTMRAAYGRTKQSESVISNWLAGEDHWFTPEQALAVGLVDEIISAEALAASPANVFACRHSVPDSIRQRILSMTTQGTSPDQIRATALDADRTRRAGIRAAFQKFAGQSGVAELQTQCEDDHTVTVEAAGHRLLGLLAKDARPVAGHYINDEANISVGGGDRRMVDFRAAVVDAFLLRAGIHVEKPNPLSADLRRVSMVGACERILSMHGKGTSGLSREQIIKAAMTTSDFPLLLSNLTGKALRTGYLAAPATHAVWTGEREVSDFKPKTLAMLSEGPALLEVPEAAEYKYGAYAESAETFVVKTFGRIVKFTRQMLINDDLDALTSIPATQGAAARRLEADLVYAKLTGNPVLSDGIALFHADHGNLAAAGAALSVASLGSSRAAMRKQRGIGGVEYIDPQPRYLIVPVALETAAETLLNSMVDPSKTNDAPNAEWIRRLTLVADPRLDAASATAWYLSADPRQIEGIIRAYLEGEARPFLDEKEGWDSDAKEYKVRLDFGVGVIDYRGLYKNPGA